MAKNQTEKLVSAVYNSKMRIEPLFMRSNIKEALLNQTDRNWYKMTTREVTGVLIVSKMLINDIEDYIKVTSKDPLDDLLV